METASERYASAVKAAAEITSDKVLTVSMVARAADAAGINGAIWFPPLSSV